jgi:subfamily B ATP-binding cassette protein MsbA
MKSSLKRLYSYAQEYWKHFIVAIVATLFLAGIESLIAWSIKPITDSILNHSNLSWYIRWMWLLLLVAITLRALFIFLADYTANIISQNIVLTIRNQLFDKFLLLPRSYHDKVSTGQSTTLITYSVNLISDFCGKSVIEILQNFALVIGLLSALIILSWKLFLFTIILCLPALLVVKYIAKKIKLIEFSVQQSMQNINHSLHESLRSINMLKVYDHNNFAKNNFFVVTSKAKAFILKNIRLNGLARVLTNFLIALPPSILIYLVINDLLDISPGVAVAAFVALLRVQLPIRKLANYNSLFQAVSVAAENVFNTLDLAEERSGGKNIVFNKENLSINIKDLSFSYTKHDLTLKDINLNISAGEKIAIVGCSGSGKSTLLKLLLDMYQYDCGNIFIEQENIKNISLKSLRRQIAYVSQESILLNLSIKENISYGLNIDLETIKAAAKNSCADEFINDLDSLYEFLIDESGSNFSGGQQQRIAIARALVRNAPILLLDEATSALDQATEKKALENIYKNINSTVCIVAHRLNSIKHLNKIVVMDQGSIVSIGTHANLIKNCDIYKKLYESQDVS